MLKIEWSEIIDFISCTISFKIYIPQLFIYLLIDYFLYFFLYLFTYLSFYSFICWSEDYFINVSSHFNTPYISIPSFPFLHFLTFISFISFPFFSHLYSFLLFFLHNYSWLATSIGSWDAYETRTETDHSFFALYTWW